MFGIETHILGDIINVVVDAIRSTLGGVLRTFSRAVESGFDATVDTLLLVPAEVTVIAIGLLLWWLVGHKIALASVAGLAAIALMGLWEMAVDTTVLVLLATLAALAVAIPLGVLMGLSDKVASVLRPVLDLMQTMPAFVYLIPAVMFLSLGKVPAIAATMIWAMPPAIRLTNLGIRGVPPDTFEAASSFGTTRWQLLYKVQFPLAMPAVMAGVNQCIMMALSMAVITSLIGGGGLGGEVMRGITRLDVGQGFEAGISIVILAIIFDRTAAALSRRSQSRTQGITAPSGAMAKAPA